MPGTNGNGGGDDFNDDTPNELPQATLAVHRPYVLVLAGCIAPLHEAVKTLQEVLHEMRTAEEPVSRRLLRNIAEAGQQIEGVGQRIAERFAK